METCVSFFLVYVVVFVLRTYNDFFLRHFSCFKIALLTMCDNVVYDYVIVFCVAK